MPFLGDMLVPRRVNLDLFNSAFPSEQHLAHWWTRESGSSRAWVESSSLISSDNWERWVCTCGKCYPIGWNYKIVHTYRTTNRWQAMKISEHPISLVGGWTHPSDKYLSNWKSFPSRGEVKQSFKPPPRNWTSTKKSNSWASKVLSTRSPLGNFKTNLTASPWEVTGLWGNIMGSDPSPTRLTTNKTQLWLL